MGLGGLELDFPSLLYKGFRILMFQLSGVYCKGSIQLHFKGPLREFPKIRGTLFWSPYNKDPIF